MGWPNRFTMESTEITEMFLCFLRALRARCGEDFLSSSFKPLYKSNAQQFDLKPQGLAKARAKHPTVTDRGYKVIVEVQECY